MGTVNNIYEKVELRFGKSTNIEERRELARTLTPDEHLEIALDLLERLNHQLSITLNIPQLETIRNENERIRIFNKIDSLYPLELTKYIKTPEWINMVNSFDWSKYVYGLPMTYQSLYYEVQQILEHEPLGLLNSKENFNRVIRFYLLNAKFFNVPPCFIKKDLDKEKYQREYMEYMKVMKINQWLVLHVQDPQKATECIIAVVYLILLLFLAGIAVLSSIIKKLQISKERYEKFLAIKQTLWKNLKYILTLPMLMWAIPVVILERYLKEITNRINKLECKVSLDEIKEILQ